MVHSTCFGLFIERLIRFVSVCNGSLDLILLIEWLIRFVSAWNGAFDLFLHGTVDFARFYEQSPGNLCKSNRYILKYLLYDDIADGWGWGRGISIYNWYYFISHLLRFFLQNGMLNIKIPMAIWLYFHYHPMKAQWRKIPIILERRFFSGFFVCVVVVFSSMAVLQFI